MSQSPIGYKPISDCYPMRGLMAGPLKWPNPHITCSFMRDGTRTSWGRSTLFAGLHSLGLWKPMVKRAFACWESACNISFTWVPDGGQPTYAPGSVQGDARFGDIRVGELLIEDVLGATLYPPGTESSGTDHGDMFLSSKYPIRIGSQYDLFSLVLHEAGHAIGVGHLAKGTVMYGTYTGIKSKLTAKDKAAAVALYGPKE